ncbi:MAG: hypothetical protein EOO64_00720 [Massilia sp.]|nr:MAG: hypothetical protein EOO64_00720 [Massilia sp.]
MSNKTIADWFSAAQAAVLAGISPSMLNYLCREKIVIPTGLPPRGHGARRAYTFGDVVALRLVSRLSLAGVSVLRLRKAMLRLRSLHPEITLTSLPGSHIVTDGRDIYIRQDGDSFERAMDGQFAFAFVVELAPLRDEVAKKVTVLRRTSSGGAKRAA